MLENEKSEACHKAGINPPAVDPRNAPIQIRGFEFIV
jgi:hypothetical protein